MSMKRRVLLAWLTVLSLKSATASERKSLTAGGMMVSWQHGDQSVVFDVTAPTNGWMAIGFNKRQALTGTRFVIAALIDGNLRIEEHIADPPEHYEVSSIGGQAHFSDAVEDASGCSTTLRFRLPHLIEGPESVTLNPDQHLYLMLAWSMETDFDHHSAWRDHIPVVL